MDKQLLSMYNSRLYRAHNTEYGALVNQTLRNAGFTLTKTNLISSKSFSGLDDGAVDKLFDKLYNILPQKKADMLSKYNLDDSFIELLSEYYDYEIKDEVRQFKLDDHRERTTDAFMLAVGSREQETGKTATQLSEKWDTLLDDKGEGGILNKLGRLYRSGKLTVEEVHKYIAEIKRDRGEKL